MVGLILCVRSLDRKEFSSSTPKSIKKNCENSITFGATWLVFTGTSFFYVFNYWWLVGMFHSQTLCKKLYSIILANPGGDGHQETGCEQARHTWLKRRCWPQGLSQAEHRALGMRACWTRRRQVECTRRWTSSSPSICRWLRQIDQHEPLWQRGQTWVETLSVINEQADAAFLDVVLLHKTTMRLWMGTTLAELAKSK